MIDVNNSSSSSPSNGGWKIKIVIFFTEFKNISTVLEMKIWIYWSESNSSIYFYIVLNKTETFTGLNKVFDAVNL